MSDDFDAIVVGSGISGGWAAKELTERGLRVVMLERGSDIEHVTDYKGEHKPPWSFKYRIAAGDRQRLEHDYATQGGTYALNEDNLSFWAKDEDWPYQIDGESPFTWTRPGGTGGRSLLWGRQVYRWSEMDFAANARDGHGIDWPIRYADVAAWYDYVERFIGVSGQAEGLAQLPDGHFQKPMEMTVVEKHLKQAVESKFEGRNVTIGRVAVLTEQIGNRAPCHYCGPCQRGCSTGSYFSTQSSTLPAARATGRLTLKTQTLVERILMNDEGTRASGVLTVNTETGERSELTARVVFLCASTLASTQVLLNSASETSPNGLGNSSGALGHYMMDHCSGNGAIGTAPGFETKTTSGHRPNGIYVPRFRNLSEEHPGFVRGYGYQGMATRSSWMRGANQRGFGQAFKESLKQPGPWTVRLLGFGECLPRHENSISLDRTKLDRWGIPQVRIRFGFSENEKAMAQDMADQAAAMLEASGCTGVLSFASMSDAIHEMGTARMGRDPSTSVLNAHNQMHDVPNVFVTDGACMTSSSCVNPSITYMALTARASAYAADQIAAGML